jgi:predicted acetyltransferase
VNHLALPIDPTSAANLEAAELRFALLDTTDAAVFGPWLQAVDRGFHGRQIDPERIETAQLDFADRRLAAVWDDSGADAATPVATASAWIADLTVPGGRSVPSWAISTITVAPSHRRRGIARNLLEAELRTAVALDVPVAVLTVSEATIYERYGFAPAAMMANWAIDTRLATWKGPKPAGRVQLVPLETVRDHGGAELLERVRLTQPGQIFFDGLLWNRLFGKPSTDDYKSIRVARYDDEAGVPQGFAIYRVTRVPRGDAVVELQYLLAATDDAYAALWRFLIELDLVTSITTHLSSIDEPLPWQLVDPRAASKTRESDHLWARILDVKAALEGRTFSAPGRLVLEVADELGFAAGRYLLEVAADGNATVTPSTDAADLELRVNELSAIYLGGVSAATLARAGLVVEQTAGAAVSADAMFRSAVTPLLSIWF